MEYKFLALMSQHEIKTLLIDYGNKTGIEMNNYLVRQLFIYLAEGREHKILMVLDKLLQDNALNHVVGHVSKFVDINANEFDEADLIHIVRENKNSIYMNEAIESNFKSFAGICVNHGRAVFSIRKNNDRNFYLCSNCLEEKANKIIYNPIRNYILRKFITSHGINISSVAKELKISESYIYKCFKLNSSIAEKNWLPIAELIQGIKNNA